jgi:pseudaminic acid cytidylyltransferase
VRIAIIPARGGSKRIPRKNIRFFLGKPMIQWAIDTATQSKIFSHIVVSTDSEEIAECAFNAGALVPFMRPKELANDHTPTREVINHTIIECTKRYGVFEHCCCIYATSPLLAKNDLIAAYQTLLLEKTNFVFSATQYPYPIHRAFFQKEDGSIQMLYPEHLKTRSQDLITAYHDAGMFYWGKTIAFLNNSPMFAQDSRPFLIPSHRVCDIDTEEDWTKAEFLMKAQNLETLQNG